MGAFTPKGTPNKKAEAKYSFRDTNKRIMRLKKQKKDTHSEQNKPPKHTIHRSGKPLQWLIIK